MKMIRRIAKISNKIAKEVESAIILPNEDAFKKYIEDHPNYREDTEFIVNGTKRQAPAKQKKNDTQMSEKELFALLLGYKRALHALASHPNEEVRCGVAEHENTSPEILDKLSNDEDWEVRRGVAYNKNTPVETLKRLSDDENADVRCSVAYNINASPEILDKLADDEDKDVRYAVAMNHNTSSETFEKLKLEFEFLDDDDDDEDIEHWNEDHFSEALDKLEFEFLDDDEDIYP